MTRKQESGIWKPEDIQPDYNGNNGISWRGTRARVVGLFLGRRLPQPKVHQGFIDLLDLDLLIYFLNYLTSSSQMDTLRRLLHADPKLKELVVNILDDLDFDYFIPDVDPLQVSGISRITLKSFHELHPTDDLKTRPIRIFTIRDCGLGRLPTSISEHRCCAVLPYLTRNTPVIIRTFGEHSLAVKRIRKWSRDLPVKFPLILIQDPVLNRKVLDFRCGNEGPEYIEPPEHLNIQRQYNTNKLHRDPALEIQNIPNYGHLEPIYLIGVCTIRLMLHFRGECISIDEELCCSPRLEVPLWMPFRISKFKKLAVAFDGPRFPSIGIIYPNLEDTTYSPTPEEVELVNNNWSESNPFGNTCEHASDKGKDSSQWCMVPMYVQPITFNYKYNNIISHVEYIGLPDGAIRLLDFDKVKKFTWRRMSPTKLHLRQVTISSNSLKSLYLFTLVRENELLPVFQCEDLERLTLVALENSAGGFNLNNLLNGNKPRNLETLRIIGPSLPKASPNLSIVSDVVQNISIRGYIPQFVTDNSCSLVFPYLRHLRIDISHIPVVYPTLSLDLKRDRFPELRLLILNCAWKSAWRFGGKDGTGVSVNLELPDLCSRVQISSAAQVKNLVVNGVQCPFTESQKYKDVYAIWLKGDDGLFSYIGLRDRFYYLDPYSE